MTTFEAMAASGEGGQLRRALRVRHLVMLSVGGTIASGFLLFAGSAIGIAGPAVIISYVIAGIITIAVMACLAELAVMKPVSASFATYAREDALDYRVIEQSQDAFEIDVTGCRYAEFYKELGEPELGFLLVCGADFTTAEGFGPDIKLTRTQTIMQGASHCDFRYKRSRETD